MKKTRRVFTTYSLHIAIGISTQTEYNVQDTAGSGHVKDSWNFKMAHVRDDMVPMKYSNSNQRHITHYNVPFSPNTLIVWLSVYILRKKSTNSRKNIHHRTVNLQLTRFANKAFDCSRKPWEHIEFLDLAEMTNI